MKQNSGATRREIAIACALSKNWIGMSPQASLRAQRSNPDCLRGSSLDCFVASLLAMTALKQIHAASQLPSPRLSRGMAVEPVAGTNPHIASCGLRSCALFENQIGMSPRRHCERSEAIQNLSAVTVWIASLRSQ